MTGRKKGYASVPLTRILAKNTPVLKRGLYGGKSSDSNLEEKYYTCSNTQEHSLTAVTGGYGTGTGRQGNYRTAPLGKVDYLCQH
jgi:hypothetical protein